MLIIRRLNCIDAASGIVTLSQWPPGAQVCKLALFYNTFIIILYMFRALYAHHQEAELYWCSIWYRHSQSMTTRCTGVKTCFILQYVFYNPLHVSSIICSSSGGWIVLMQHLISSLSVSDHTVHRCANLRTGWSLTESDDTRCCINEIQPPDDVHIMIETCRGL